MIPKATSKAMPTCHECGQDIPERVTFHGLLLDGRGGIYWQGIRQPRIAPMRYKFLWALARRGFASYGALWMLTTDGAGSDKLITVHIHHIRKWLLRVGLPFKIKNNPKVGYSLDYLGN